MFQRVTKDLSSRRMLESNTIQGDSPVRERQVSLLQYSQVPGDTCNPVGIWVDHHPRLNITTHPIVNQYREGKVKRTPGGGVK